MEATSSVLQFSFFIVFALLGTVVSMKLRQPYVVGLLIFGALAGPHMLGLVQDTGLILTFSELGAILLLFAVGIEFSVPRILKSGFRAVVVTLFKMGVLFFFGYEAALYFGLDLTTALFLGAMVSITSTAILFKIVNEKGMGKHPLLPLIFSMLIVEDIIAVAALTFFSSLGGGAATYDNKLQSVLLSLGLLGGFYLIIRRPAAQAIERLTSSLSEEVMIFVSFSLCLVMSLAAAFFGLSPAIGAFLAGSIVASLPNARRIEKAIKPLLLMFAALFFLSLGMRIDPSAVLGNLLLASVMVLVFVSICFVSVLLLLYGTGSTSKSALFGASSMVVMGEFSLIIASVAPSQHAPLLLAVGSFGVVVSAIASSLLLDRQARLLALGQQSLPRSVISNADSLSAYFTGLVKDFSPGGSVWQFSHAFWMFARRRLAVIAAIVVLLIISRFLVGISGIPQQDIGALRAALLLLALAPIAYLSIDMLRDFRLVIDALSRTIARHGSKSRDETIMLRDFTVSLVLAIFALLLPDAVSFLQLPPFFNFGDEILFLLALVFIWDLLRHAGRLRRKAGR